MSTYKRPDLLKQQLTSLSYQTFTNFEVVISDNDPLASAKEIVSSFDARFKYYHNGENLGMIKSFNKSIERASTDYIVMVTDDDPVEAGFLADMYNLYEANRSYGIYAGFLRLKKNPGEVELLNSDIFPAEILDPVKTSNILWSSCIVKKSIAISIGKIPDYGSPHLADNAFVAIAGSIRGGVIVNKIYSTLTSHNNNYSKSNLDSYVAGCVGFYNTVTNYFRSSTYFPNIKNAIDGHLKEWFISNIFTLKKYYTKATKNSNALRDVELSANSILELDFMKKYRIRYFLKNVVFLVKKRLRLL